MKELAFHILDILENSIEAEAKNVELYIWEDKKKDLLSIKITDDGKGMTKKVLEKTGEPFVTTKNEPNAGLGLYLLKCEAEASGGKLTVTSERKKGTTVLATFKYSNAYRKPLGNIADSLAAFIHRTDDIELKYIHITGNKEYVFDTKQIKKELGITNTKSYKVFENLKVFLKSKIPGEY